MAILIMQYHWLVTIFSSVFTIAIAAYVFLPMPLPGAHMVYLILSVPGVLLVAYVLAWNVCKLVKALIDLCSGHVDPKDKVVLVTGCSSGFGYALTVRLDQMGFKVIGCCRKIDAPNVKKLQDTCSDRLRVIRMDVASDEEVDFVAGQFGDWLLPGEKLWAVVNNAGIAAVHGVEWGSGMHLYKECFDVNTLGMIRVSRTFLPFLRKTKGSRLVIVTSVEDRMEPPNQPAYAASKFAARAFANACRRELRDKNVYVSVVEPAFYATELASRDNLMGMLERNWNETSDKVKTAYGEKGFKRLVDFTEGLYALIHKDIEPVVETMAKVVSKNIQPHFFYKVCSLDELPSMMAMEWMPEEVVDVIWSDIIMINSLKTLLWFKNLFGST